MVPKQYRQLRKVLVDWYQHNQRNLPWRQTRDPYKIWISEVMLQQTQVNTVIPYYQRFLAGFPDIHDLAESGLQNVLKMWEGLGYYSRARNLHKTANIVVNDHAGVIPDSLTEIKKLPGVGDYIAAAVLSIAYNIPQPVVDGNVKRVFSRLFRIDAPVNDSKSHTVFKEKSHELMDPAMPAAYNQALMELGALVCKPQNPHCQDCPLQSHCLAYKDDKIKEYPRRIKTKPIPKYAIAVGVVMKKGKVLITRRKDEGLLGGLWEFPGGRISPSESPETTCLRILKTKVNLTVGAGTFVTRIKHAYTHFKITVDVFTCRYKAGRVKLNGPVDFRWIHLDEIEAYPLHKANHKFIPALRKVMKSSA